MPGVAMLTGGPDGTNSQASSRDVTYLAIRNVPAVMAGTASTDHGVSNWSDSSPTTIST